MIGCRTQQALLVGGVGDERNGTVVAAERRPGQSEAAGCVGEGLPDAFTPALGVPAVVDFIEDHQRAPVLGAHPVPHRVAGHLGIGHHDAVVVVRGGGVGVGEPRIQRDSGHRSGGRPLCLEVFGGHHDGDSLHRAIGEQFAGDPQRERCFACSGRCYQQKVTWPSAQIAHQCPPLPAPQSPGAGRLDCPHPQVSLLIVSDSNAIRSGWTAARTRVEEGVHRG